VATRFTFYFRERGDLNVPLFEVAILQLPTAQELERGKCEKLVFGPKTVVANDHASAGIAAVMESKEGLPELDVNRLQVLTRPFVNSG
jgi:hypothetical protein